MNLSKERKVALMAAKAAGRTIMRYYGRKESIRVKPNKSLVTIADMAANKAIISTLKKSFPDYSIISEESGIQDRNSDFKWVIDPLDGTHNFIHKLPIFGTSIALAYMNEPVLGITHFPMLNITSIAEKGKGAFSNGKRLKVSSKKNLDHSFVLCEFAYANRKEKTAFLEKLVHKTIDIRNFGSAIYNLWLIAAGKCEGYVLLSTHEWDVAAGFLIVEEAGGKITDLEGKRRKLTQEKFIVSNGKVHNEMLEYMK
jgi:myo-inositol-1(or 4)-monophosphatase